MILCSISISLADSNSSICLEWVAVLIFSIISGFFKAIFEIALIAFNKFLFFKTSEIIKNTTFISSVWFVPPISPSNLFLIVATAIIKSEKSIILVWGKKIPLPIQVEISSSLFKIFLIISFFCSETILLSSATLSTIALIISSLEFTSKQGNI